MDANLPPKRSEPGLDDHELIDIDSIITSAPKPTVTATTLGDKTPEPELSETDRRRTMNLSVLEGFPAMVFINWTTGSVLTGLAILLGASAQQIALLTAMPLLGQVASPVAAWLMALAGARKPLAVAAALLGRGLWVLAIVLPLLPLTWGRTNILLLLIALSSVFVAANGALWTSWMSDVVPARERGRYFGLRGGILGVVGMLANLLAGVMLDRLPSPLDFQVVYGVGVACGVLAAVLLLAHSEPPMKTVVLKLSETIFMPLKDRQFQRFLLFTIYWTASVLVAAPFVYPYFLKYLKMSFTQVAIWSIIAAVCGLVTSAVWGRIADRVGNKPVLAINTVLAGTLLPLSWMLASSTNLWPIWISGAIDALVWGALGPAYFNLAVVSAPQSQRAAYIAVLSAVQGMVGFAVAAGSGVLFGLFVQWGASTSQGFSAYHWLFLLSGSMRALAWLWLRPVAEERAWRTRDVLDPRCWQRSDQ
jgi:MFS family permease